MQNTVRTSIVEDHWALYLCTVDAQTPSSVPKAINRVSQQQFPVYLSSLMYSLEYSSSSSSRVIGSTAGESEFH
jgi:hypothetical protein